MPRTPAAAHRDASRTGARDGAGAREAALLGLLSLAVAMGIGRFAFTPVLPVMVADAGLSVSAGAWLAAGNYAGYLAGALAAIRVSVASDRAVIGATLAIAVLTAAMALTGSFAAWFALRTLAGVASAFALVHVAAWTALRIAQQPALNGVVFAGVGSGIAVTGLLCAALLARRATSAELWLALGALALAVVLFCAWRLRALDGAQVPAAGPTATLPDRGQGPDRHTWRLIVCYGVSGFGYIVPATFLPVMARAVLDAAWFAWVWPLFGLAAALSAWAVARFVPPARARAAWAVAQLAMALGTGVIALSASPAALFIAAVCVGGTFVVITMVGFIVARQAAATAVHVRPLLAAMTSAFALGQIAGPVLVGVVKDADAFRIPHAAAAVLLAASVLLLRRGRAPAVHA